MALLRIFVAIQAAFRLRQTPYSEASGLYGLVRQPNSTVQVQIDNLCARFTLIHSLRKNTLFLLQHCVLYGEDLDVTVIRRGPGDGPLDVTQPNYSWGKHHGYVGEA